MFDHDDSATAAGYAEARKGKAKHTPGPWGVGGFTPEGGRGVAVGIGAPPRDVIVVGKGGGPDEVLAEDRANARLIAAAPELLQALRLAAACMHNISVKPLSIDNAIKTARAAIAKAEGRAE